MLSKDLALLFLVCNIAQIANRKAAGGGQSDIEAQKSIGREEGESPPEGRVRVGRQHKYHGEAYVVVPAQEQGIQICYVGRVHL